MSNGQIGAAVILGLVVAIAAVIGRAVARRKAGWQEATEKLGLQPLDSLDPALSDAILALHKPPNTGENLKTEWSLIRIFRCPEPGVDCYSVTIRCDETREVWRTGTAIQSRTTEKRVVALQAPGRIDAPRMNLIPKAVLDPGAGRLAAAIARAGNTIVDSVTENDPERVMFSDDSEFEGRYLVRAPEVDSTRAFLNPARRRALITLDGVQMSLSGSLLLVASSAHAITHRSQSLAEQLDAELGQARRVLAIFSST